MVGLRGERLPAADPVPGSPGRGRSLLPARRRRHRHRSPPTPSCGSPSTTPSTSYRPVRSIAEASWRGPAHEHHQRPGRRHRVHGPARPRHLRSPCIGAYWCGKIALQRPAAAPVSTAPPSRPWACWRPAPTSWRWTPSDPITDNAGGIIEMSEPARGGPRPHRPAGRRRQHDQGTDQGIRHRLRRPRRLPPLQRLHWTRCGRSPARAVDVDLTKRAGVRRRLSSAPRWSSSSAPSPSKAVGEGGPGRHRRGAAAVPRRTRASWPEPRSPTTRAASTSSPPGPCGRWSFPASSRSPRPSPWASPSSTSSSTGQLGAESVAALLMVGTIAGILMATFMNNGGGAWDNAKKYIESGEFTVEGMKAGKKLGAPQGGGRRRHRRAIPSRTPRAPPFTS